MINVQIIQKKEDRIISEPFSKVIIGTYQPEQS
jgi:hypothetical protein